MQYIYGIGFSEPLNTAILLGSKLFIRSTLISRVIKTELERSEDSRHAELENSGQPEFIPSIVRLRIMDIGYLPPRKRVIGVVVTIPML